ncbi:Putative uncharacterized protein [Moritella viscosa]|nr:Putative uncharacterized protein [Moritella viscosa]
MKIELFEAQTLSHFSSIMGLNAFIHQLYVRIGSKSQLLM